MCVHERCTGHNDPHSTHNRSTFGGNVWSVLTEETWICIRDPGEDPPLRRGDHSHPKCRHRGSNTRHSGGEPVLYLAGGRWKTIAQIRQSCTVNNISNPKFIDNGRRSYMYQMLCMVCCYSIKISKNAPEVRHLIIRNFPMKTKGRWAVRLQTTAGLTSWSIIRCVSNHSFWCLSIVFICPVYLCPCNSADHVSHQP